MPEIMESPNVNLTVLLHACARGDREAEHKLIAIAYPKLRGLAAGYIRRERPNQTLQATELVNELYLKVFSHEPVQWRDRVHFFAIAARELRLILVDHARRSLAGKRWGRHIRVSLTHAEGSAGGGEEVVALHDALEALEELDPRAARGVELKFFGGLSETEIAEVLGTSTTTVKRDWKFARAWLLKELQCSTGAS